MHTLDIMINEIVTKDELQVYEWLRDVVRTLGNDGTSSDESSVDEDGMSVYTVKRLPWRRNIEKELAIIDALRTQEQGIYTRRGSKPLKRIRDVHGPVSTREPVRGLPRIFYDAVWLQSEPQGGRRLRVADEPSGWMKLCS
jgi:hypothetical protein